MRLTGLPWTTVLLPTAAIVLFDYARHELINHRTHSWWEEAVLLVGVFLVTFGSSQILLARVDGSRRREREADTLRRIGVEMTSSLELEAIVASVLARGHEILGADCLGVALADSPCRELIALSRPSAHLLRLQEAPGVGFLWDTIESGEGRERLRSASSPTGAPCSSCVRCFALPLRMGPHVLGALCVGSSAPAPRGPEIRHLAGQLANLASVSIANALLHQRAQNVATLEERDRIARELHDTLAQVLGYLSMMAGSARQLLAHRDLAPLDAQLAEMVRVSDEAYLDVREAILGLRVSTHKSGALAEALQEYLQKFSRQSGVNVRLEAPEPAALHIPPNVEMQVVRVIQEALTNVRKHARATSARVTVEQRDGRLLVRVEDDGRGFDPVAVDERTDRGYGLETMRERLSGVGGRLAVESAPGRGTMVVATVPLSATGLESDGTH